MKFVLLATVVVVATAATNSLRAGLGLEPADTAFTAKTEEAQGVYKYIESAGEWLKEHLDKLSDLLKSGSTHEKPLELFQDAQVTDEDVYGPEQDDDDDANDVDGYVEQVRESVSYNDNYEETQGEETQGEAIGYDVEESEHDQIAPGFSDNYDEDASILNDKELLDGFNIFTNEDEYEYEYEYEYEVETSPELDREEGELVEKRTISTIRRNGNLVEEESVTTYIYHTAQDYLGSLLRQPA